MSARLWHMAMTNSQKKPRGANIGSGNAAELSACYRLSNTDDDYFLLPGTTYHLGLNT